MSAPADNPRLKKVIVSLAVWVDADGWALDYGTDPADLKRDVRTYAADAVLYANPAIKGVDIRDPR